ncbi:MAG: hypothetical protein AB1Z19_06655 [Eubacteriales bacterium]
MVYSGFYGLKEFMMEVLGLVSRHAFEPTWKILSEMENQRVVSYIAERYPVNQVYRRQSGVYDTQSWEKAFYDRCHYRDKEELATKFNIYGDDDGLLLVVSFGMDYLTEL